MENYLVSIRYACDNLINLIWDTRKEYISVRTRYLGIKKMIDLRMKRIQNGVLTIEEQRDFNELTQLYGVRTGNTGIAVIFEESNLRSKIAELENIMTAHSDSYNILSGALLQMAKQALSIVHGDIFRKRITKGRVILEDGSNKAFLLDCIQHFRNHSIHFEQGLIRSHDSYKFFKEKLIKDKFPNFNDKSTNYSFEFINLLGWDEFNKFKNDLKSIITK